MLTLTRASKERARVVVRLKGTTSNAFAKLYQIYVGVKTGVLVFEVPRTFMKHDFLLK